MSKFWFDEKENVLYIATKILGDNFKLSYEKRIEMSQYKDEIKKEIEKHKGCKISEFTTL